MVFSISLAPLFRPVLTSGSQGLGFINNNVASARQPHLALESIIDLRLNTKAVEDWLRSRVELKMLLLLLQQLSPHFLNPLPP